MIFVRKVNINKVDKQWLGEAFAFNSYRNNFDSIQQLNDYDLYIVHKDNRDIGFFLLHIYTKLKEVGTTYWPHPRFCRMNMLPIIQVAAVAAINYGKNNRLDSLMMRTADGLPCRMIKKMYDSVDSLKIMAGVYILYGRFASIRLIKDIVTYPEKDNFDCYEVDI
jgi:hypothetical protein